MALGIRPRGVMRDVRPFVGVPAGEPIPRPIGLVPCAARGLLPAWINDGGEARPANRVGLGGMGGPPGAREVSCFAVTPT